MGHSQESLNTQLDHLSDLAKDSGFGAATLSRILHPSNEPLIDTEIRSQLLQCVAIANKAGLYDAADYVRYQVLKLQ